MAVSEGRKIVKGSDLMLFIDDSGTYKSIAHASSHTLSLSADVEELNTKDTGKWGVKEVNKINWEIQTQNLYTIDGYDKMFDLMLASEPVNIMFGLKATSTPGTETVNVDADGNWTYAYTSTKQPYFGKAIITSLECTAEAGSRAQFSATLQGQGAIARLTYTSGSTPVE